jgi:hypothetical protein
MSRQSTFSKLTMAATVLFVASITGFAQDQSAKSQTETAGVEIVAVNKAPKSVDLFTSKASASKTVSAKKENGFSAAKFMEAARESINDTVLNVSTPASIENRSMKAEDFGQPTKSSSIVFVPSRGQRYPFQQ